MSIPKNYERENRILDCWKQDMTIDQATANLKEKRSTVGYYYKRFNKAEKRGELQKYLPEEIITGLDKTPSRYNNTLPIKQSDSKGTLSKYEEAFMDLIFYDKFQSSYLKEDYQKAYYVYQTWMAGKNWENKLRKTGIEEVQKALDLMASRTHEHNAELEKEINNNLNKIIGFKTESNEDERTEETLPESRIDKIFGPSRRKPKRKV